jgi:8-oxo-dGTP pyrophosphatase MutT (NUDIX family)
MKTSLTEIKAKIDAPLRQATLLFLVKEKHILLAMKKRGFGAGKWNGVGGKKKDEESVEETATRETKEEIGVTVSTIVKVAVLNFFFLETPDWNQQVIVYLAGSWSGEPTESEEMSPKWFNKKEIPYEKMWWDDKIWLPKVLEGQKVEADFLFDGDQKVIEQNVREFHP